MAKNDHDMRIVVPALLTIALAVILLVASPANSFDARFHFEPSTISPYLEALGETGRRSYVLAELVDFAFMAAYSLLAWRVWTVLLGPSRLRIFVLGPGLLDVIETSLIIAVCMWHPRLPPPMGSALSATTTVKWFSAAAMVTATVMLWLRRRSRRARDRERRA